jgi:CHAT domain-containing protein/Tfp pilus assembly protein PilF
MVCSLATGPCFAQAASPAPSSGPASRLEQLAQQEQSLERDGKYNDAIPVAEELLKLTRQAFDGDDPAVAHACLVLAKLYYRVANLKEAEVLCRETLRIYEKIGAESEEVASARNVLEKMAIKLFCQEQELENQRKYAEAIPLAEQVLGLTKESLGSDNLTIGLEIEILAGLYDKVGRYRPAEQLYLEALEITRKSAGLESKEAAEALKRLALIYYDMGEYGSMESRLQEELGIEKKEFGPESKEVAGTYGNLAAMYMSVGDYARAEQLLHEEMKIERQTLGPESQEFAATLDNLGVLYTKMGDYAAAEPLGLEALRIEKKVLGPENRDVARTLNNLAQVYMAARKYEKAAYFYGQALGVARRVLGPEDLYVAVTLNNLGLLWDEVGKYAEAEPLYLESLRIVKKIDGPEHPATATTLDNLGLLYHRMGQYTKAEPFYLEALGIYTKSFGDEHPDTITCRRKLALLDIDRGRADDASAFALTAWNNQSHLVEKILSFASEQQRLAYQSSNTLFSLAVLAATKGNEPALALAILREKGVVLDSLMEDQAFYRANRQTAGAENLLNTLTADKQRIGRLLMQRVRNSAESKQELESLQDEVQVIESKLAKDVTSAGRTRRALTVTTEQIVSTLPDDTALIEYYSRGNYLGHVDWEPAYGAAIFSRTREPIFVRLPSTKVVSPTIKRYLNLLNRRDPPDDEEVAQKSAELYQQIWAPIQRILPGTIKRVIISPDGQLNFISFATLLDSEQRFLGEALLVEYVAAGRDLLEATPAADNKDCVMLANPDFQDQPDESSSNNTKMRGAETEELQNLHFDSLTGTVSEVSRLETLMESWNWKPSVLVGSNAAKAALFKLHHPYILHLATHGFFCSIHSEDWKPSDSSGLEENRVKYFDNPMHRSGLAFTGANVTVAAWRNRKDLAAVDDGILTAEDAAGLDLTGTWLVTLSACQTGEGEANAGEGVMGLRRGFLEAGAVNILMTLWKISDDYTGEFMNDFYRVAHASGNAPLALATVQCDSLRKLRKEKGLAAAVRLAGPFVLCFRGKP